MEAYDVGSGGSDDGGGLAGLVRCVVVTCDKVGGGTPVRIHVSCKAFPSLPLPFAADHDVWLFSRSDCFWLRKGSRWPGYKRMRDISKSSLLASLLAINASALHSASDPTTSDSQ
jgi:hypothetical protein